MSTATTPFTVGFFGKAGQEVSNRWLEGILRYLQEQPNLKLRDFRFVHDFDVDQTAPPPPWKGKADGMILCFGMVGDAVDEVSAWLERGAVPAVSLASEWAIPGVPVVSSDKDAVMRMAAEYFLNQNYEQFALVGDSLNPADSIRRRAVFHEKLMQHGYQPECCDLSSRPEGGIEDVARVHGETELAELLRELPKPLAVFAITDQHARVVCTICEELRFRVPEDVAILGSGNLTASRSQSPMLSSVKTAADAVGYQAAEWLHRMMLGESAPTKPTLLPPLAVIERESTRSDCEQGNPLRQALDFIHEHACEGISVADVVRSVPIARRTLEEHFAERIGHSPGQEIQRVRLQRAQKLLTETELSITQVAAMLGFNETARLTEFFRKQTGQTPTEYRAAPF